MEPFSSLSGPVVVTGCAGFIGSHLTDRLLAEGVEVRGVDAFTDYYDRSLKEANLKIATSYESFDFHEADLRTADLRGLLDGASVVFHQAAQPGVRSSWRDGFGDYVSTNVHATQMLLEACVCASVQRLVYASSSSVYGNAERYPCTEDLRPRPHSPYGVTKLAAEHLCRLYAQNFGLSTVSLRYFTVYGPRQRPDMAIHRIITSALSGRPFRLFGDGSHVRDFTFVSDVVEANLRAADPTVLDGLVCNVAGGTVTSMREVIDTIGGLVGTPVPVEQAPPQPGDVLRTDGDTNAALADLGWAPTVALQEGLQAHVKALTPSARNTLSGAPIPQTRLGQTRWDDQRKAAGQPHRRPSC